MSETKDGWALVLRLEDLSSELTDISNTLSLYDDLLWDEVAALDPNSPGLITNFKGRYKLSQSMLSVIRCRLYDILEGLEGEISDCFESEKSEPAQIPKRLEN